VPNFLFSDVVEIIRDFRNSIRARIQQIEFLEIVSTEKWISSSAWSIFPNGKRYCTRSKVSRARILHKMKTIKNAFPERVQPQIGPSSPPRRKKHYPEFRKRNSAQNKFAEAWCHSGQL